MGRKTSNGHHIGCDTGCIPMDMRIEYMGNAWKGHAVYDETAHETSDIWPTSHGWSKGIARRMF